MAGLQWFELDTAFFRDPKVKELQARLREPLADAYVARLYGYCFEHIQERFATEVAISIIEDACGWKGRLGTLFDKLMAVGILEREPGKVIVHGVKARLGPHVAHRSAAAARQKRRREKHKEAIEKAIPVERDVARDVPETSRGSSRPPMSMSMSGNSRSDGTSSNDETSNSVPSADAWARELDSEVPPRPRSLSSRPSAVAVVAVGRPLEDP